MPTKLQKFAEFQQFKICFSYLYDDYIKQNNFFFFYGKWNEDYFKNNYPIIIEIGCGRGEYTTELAKRYPHKNFIGIDFKSNRMWMGAKQALNEQLNNIAFLRTKVEFLDKVFAENEISEIWITFPDPQIKKSKARKRLTNPNFLKLYKKFLNPNARIHLKTDNDIFFNYTIDVLSELNIQAQVCSYDLYNDNSHPCLEEVKSIQTYYEKLFSALGHTIKYCKFQIK